MIRKLLLSLSTLCLFSSCVLLPLPHTTRRSPQINGRVLDAQSRRPVQSALVQLAARPSVATKTKVDGRFSLGSTHNFHILWYANPSFVNHFPDGPEWSNAFLVTHPNYRQKTFDASNAFFRQPAQHDRAAIILKDIYLEPHKQ